MKISSNDPNYLGLAILAFFVGLADGVKGMTIDEAILKDVMFNQGSVNCQDTGQTETTFIHTPSPSTWSAGLDEQHNFLAQMTHNDTDLNNSWTVRFGKGGSIYSMISGYGEAIPPQTLGEESAWVDEVTQAVAIDMEKNWNPMPHYIHQAGTYLKDAVLEKPFYSPNVAKHCEHNSCSFGTWGQIAAIPNIYDSDVIYYVQYRNCGNGVMEYIQMFTGDFGNNLAYLNMPWAGVRTSSLPDLYLSNTQGEMEPKRDPLNRWNKDIVIPRLQDTGGYSTFGQNGQHDPALSYVHGICEECNDADHTYFRAPSRLRFGLSRRDYTVFTINGQLTAPRWKGEQIYVHRQFIINNQLGNIELQAQSWVSEARGDMLTPSDFTGGRALELYSDDNSVFGAATASSRGGTSTSCDKGTTKCSGKTVPTTGMVPIFAITCGNLKYVGSNKYFFSPAPDENMYIRSYVCDGQGLGIIPEWKLLGYFPDGDCDSLSIAEYDPSFCIAATDSSTNSPIRPTDSPTDSIPSSPTDSPNKNPIYPPRGNARNTPTNSPTDSSTPTETSTDTPSTSSSPTSEYVVLDE